MSRRWKVVGCRAPFWVAAGLLVFSALTSAPTSDEVAHLTAGIAIVRSGDPGFYRVNPPLHKIVSGLAVELVIAPELPPLYPASWMGSGARQEFSFAEQFLKLHHDDYAWSFWVGRLVRIPLILLAAWGLWRVEAGRRKEEVRTWKIAGGVAAVLWCFCPMVLGHGWTLMPDALSGAAMVLLLVSTFTWLRTHSWLDWWTVGVAWGVAIGTKFTFCPLYALWVLPLAMFAWLTPELASALSVQRAKSHSWPRLRFGLRLFLGHVGQGFVALFVVIGLYGAADVGVTLGNHAFGSDQMRSIAHALPSLPSPFPKQFLIGIDEQQMDLERGHATYFRGTWYPEGVWWYYVAGFFAKSSIAVWLGIVAMGIGAKLKCGVLSAECGGREEAREEQGEEGGGGMLVGGGGELLDAANRRPKTSSWDWALFWFCAVVVLMVFGVLSWHSRMALNVRYLFPALPPLFLMIGLGVAWCVQGWRAKTRRQAAIAAGVLIAVETMLLMPDPFSYANPVLGGSRRVPPVLHDSNFDGGQDLWRLERWLRNHPPGPSVQRYVCIHTHVPDEAISFVPNPPPVSVLDAMLDENNDSLGPGNVEIIAMRGLSVPAPWTRLHGITNSATGQALRELLLTPPDEFISDTIVLYRNGESFESLSQ